MASSAFENRYAKAIDGLKEVNEKIEITNDTITHQAKNIVGQIREANGEKLDHDIPQVPKI